VLKNRLVDLEALEAQARYRGFEARLPHGCAEAFGAARFVWDLGLPTTEAQEFGRHALETREEVRA
jgi:hypothetical protein